MFLDNLTEPQKFAFLALAEGLIRADLSRQRAERDALYRLKAEMGLMRDTNPPAVAQETAIAAFRTRRSRVAVMLELLCLGFCDRGFSAPEHLYLRDLARHFAIPEADLLAMEEWAARQATLRAEAEEMLKSRGPEMLGN